jgi:pimeloyl-ACP methyl ester carboxylesterase
MLIDEGYCPVADGVRLYYQRSGDGPSTILIPNATSWAADLEALAPKHTCIFYDLRCRGRSDTVTDSAQIGMEQDLLDLDTLRRFFGLEQVTMLAWSYLGATAALYAARYPQHIERLVIGGSALRRTPWWGMQLPDAHPERPIDSAGLRYLEELRATGVATRDPTTYCQERQRVFLAYQAGKPEALAQMRSNPCAHPNEWPGNAWFPAYHAAVGDYDWRAEVALVAVPTLVLHGMADVLPLAAAQECVATLAQARLYTITDVGHFPWLEAPEVFFPVVNAFFEGIWPTEPGHE